MAKRKDLKEKQEAGKLEAQKDKVGKGKAKASEAESGGASGSEGPQNSRKVVDIVRKVSGNGNRQRGSLNPSRC